MISLTEVELSTLIRESSCCQGRSKQRELDSVSYAPRHVIPWYIAVDPRNHLFYSARLKGGITKVKLHLDPGG